MAHPLVMTQISQLHPDFIRAIVGVNVLYFCLAVKPPRFICIKAAVQRKGLLWRPMVLQRDLWTRDNSKTESWSMKGSLVWCVESNRNSSRKTPYLEVVTSSRRAMMPHQASAKELDLSVLHKQIRRSYYPCPLQQRKRYNISLSGEDWKESGLCGPPRSMQQAAFKMQITRLVNTSTSRWETSWSSVCTNSYHPGENTLRIMAWSLGCRMLSLPTSWK